MLRFPRNLPRVRAVVLAASLTAGAGLMAPVTGQVPDSVTLVPGPQYRADLPLAFLSSRVYGKRYRAAWTTPITIPRFDPARFAGGLTLLRADTGVRAGYFYFRETATRLWTFRSFEPTLSAIFPEGMRRQAVTEVLDDLASGALPGAALVVGPLAEAAGIRVPPSRLVAWDSIAGYLVPGIQTPYLDELGAPDGSITTSALLERMTAAATVRIDHAGYLRERLFDLWVGHTDLTPQHWRWIPAGDQEWRPAERNRDAAFARYDGLIPLFTTAGLLRFTTFGEKYDRTLGLTSQLTVIDRRLLTGLPDSTWGQVAAIMQGALTDTVIAEAVRRLPAAYQAGLAPTLASQLRQRRDALPTAAQRFRDIVLHRVDLYGTTEADVAEARRDHDGAVTVRVGDGFERRFDPRVTSYIHLYLLGGADSVTVSGPGSSGPVLQVAGTPGMIVVDSSRGRLEVFSPQALSLSGPGKASRRDRRLDPPQVSDSLRQDLPPPMGYTRSPVLWVDITSELGVLLGGGITRRVFNPEYTPWHSQVTMRAGYAFGMNTAGAELVGQWRLAPLSNTSMILTAKYSGMENLNYFGYGNDTERDESAPDRYYWAGQTHLIVAPGIRAPVGEHGQADFELVYKNVSTTDDTTRYIVQQSPYGVGADFSQLGVRVTLAHDTRDHPLMASRGIRLEAAGTIHPATLDAVDPFGKGRVSVAGAVTPRGFQDFTLAGRVAGEYAWGTYPVHEAAFLGGSNNLRSHKKGRYAGDATVFGNVDARLRVLTLPFILRWDAGFYGLGDVGRVYLKGESSNTWHYSAGGGIWMASSDRGVIGRMEIATGDDGIGFRFGTAFKF